MIPRLLLLTVLLCVGCGSAFAQSPAGRTSDVRWLVGASGGDSLNNYFVGPSVGVEIPFGRELSSCYMDAGKELPSAPPCPSRGHVGKNAASNGRNGLHKIVVQELSSTGEESAPASLQRFEFSARDTISPEIKLGYGSGFSNIVRGGGTVWLTSTIGVSTAAEYSHYDVSAARKTALYEAIGLTYRKTLSEVPMRISLNYMHQFHNGISPTGIETSHLTGADVEFSAIPACYQHYCIRVTFDTTAVHILQQGNPICDGSLPNTQGFLPCPRRGAWTGGATMSVQFQFGGRGL